MERRHYTAQGSTHCQGHASIGWNYYLRIFLHLEDSEMEFSLEPKVGTSQESKKEGLWPGQLTFSWHDQGWSWVGCRGGEGWEAVAEKARFPVPLSFQ